MKWPPGWLGKSYSKLYVSLGEETFTLSEAAEILGFKKELSRTVLSRLKRYYLVSVFSRRRNKVYRLLDPETWVLTNALGIRNLDEIKQGTYFNLVCKVIKSLIKHGKPLTSLVLYGSVARGTAGSTSDIDLLIVSEGFTGTIGKRIDELVSMEEPWVKEEISWLSRKGIYADVSYLPLRPEEATFIRSIYLDLVYDAIILYDEDHFFEKIIDKLRARLTLLESRRVFIGENDWYWVLKPDVKEGEIIEIE